jgi:hypothetical protein
MKSEYPYNFIQWLDDEVNDEKGMTASAKMVGKISQDLVAERLERLCQKSAWVLAVSFTSCLDECMPLRMALAHDLLSDTIRLTRVSSSCDTNNSDAIMNYHSYVSRQKLPPDTSASSELYIFPDMT